MALLLYTSIAVLTGCLPFRELWSSLAGAREGRRDLRINHCTLFSRIGLDASIFYSNLSRAIQYIANTRGLYYL